MGMHLSRRDLLVSGLKLTAGAVAIAALPACGSGGYDDPFALLRFANLSLDSAPLNLYLESGYVAGPVPFQSVTNVAEIFLGSRQVRAQSSVTNAVVASSIFTAQNGASYLSVAFGRAAAIETKIFEQAFAPLNGGQLVVKFANVYPSLVPASVDVWMLTTAQTLGNTWLSLPPSASLGFRGESASLDLSGVTAGTTNARIILCAAGTRTVVYDTGLIGLTNGSYMMLIGDRFASTAATPVGKSLFQISALAYDSSITRLLSDVNG